MDRAIYTDDWTYVRLFYPGVFSHPGLYNDLPDGGLELLHDCTSDAPATENLVDDRPEVISDLRERFGNWTISVV